MADIWFDINTSLPETPVTILPLISDTDFKTRQTAVAYNAAGMDLVWNFMNLTGDFSQTAVTPTTGGAYDWVHQGDGIYTIEIPATGGVSINNNREGYGWFTGIATGVLPWRGPVIGFRSGGLPEEDFTSSSIAGIVNLSLSHLAIGREIANLDTEQSQEASTARRYWGQGRDAILRDFPWPFATKITTVALVSEDPNDEWAYSYRYPSDCLYIRRILSGSRNDTRQSRISYKIASDTSGRLIFTDKQDAEIEYTAKATDPSLYPSDFTMALSFYLAFLMAPRVTAGDQFKLGERAMRLYQLEINRAVSRAFNEEQADELPESEFIRGR